MNQVLDRSNYECIWAATSKLVAHGRLEVSPATNRDVFDVSLVSGHRGLFDNNRSSFDDLSRVTEDVLVELGQFEMISVLDKACTHLTIFPLYQDKSIDFPLVRNLAQRARDYGLVLDVLAKFPPLSATFSGLCLSPNGVVILQGFSDGIEAVRSSLNDMIPDKQRKSPNIFHVTLARLHRAASREEFLELYRWTERRRMDDWGTVDIEHPKFVATSDQYGTVICQQEMAHLEKWNGVSPSYDGQK